MAPQPGIKPLAVSHVQLTALPAVPQPARRGVYSRVSVLQDTILSALMLSLKPSRSGEGGWIHYSLAESEKKLGENMVRVWQSYLFFFFFFS